MLLKGTMDRSGHTDIEQTNTLSAARSGGSGRDAEGGVKGRRDGKWPGPHSVPVSQVAVRQSPNTVAAQHSRC